MFLRLAHFNRPAMDTSTESFVSCTDASTALSTADGDFIRDICNILRRDIALARDYGGLLTAISNRLDQFHNQDQIQQVSTWTHISCVSAPKEDSDCSNSLRIVITGPLTEDRFELTAKSRKEASEIVRL